MMTFSNDPYYTQFIRLLADILTAPANNRVAVQTAKGSDGNEPAGPGAPFAVRPHPSVKPAATRRSARGPKAAA
jgi:hypothetical protein